MRKSSHELPDENKIIHSGYRYSHPVTSEEWIEFHIDDIGSVCKDCIVPFGGNVSIRSPVGSKPLIIFGQDESIFNQFSHSGKQSWKFGESPPTIVMV